MARCERCDACRNMFDMRDCPRCNYPREDIRTPEVIAIDDADYEERMRENGYYDDDENEKD